MKKSKKDNPRVVIDTNLLISATITSNGLPNKLIQSWQYDQITLIISPRLVSELEEVSQKDKFRRYHLFKEQIVELIDSIKASAEIIQTIADEQLPIHSRDPKDDKLLSCALAADADYLISGDEDLLILNGNPSLGKLKIVSVNTFLDTLTKLS